ncbi:MAG: hypothetical protein ACMZ7B_11720 [Balneola sp.]
MSTPFDPKHAELLELVDTVSASLAFSALVTDAAGAAVIHVDGSTTNQLVISITNQTSGDITFAQLKGPASSGNCNLLLKLPNNQLYFYNAPAIDGASTPGSWVLATDSASGGAGWVDTIYLANTGTCKLTANGTAGDTLSVVINYSGAVPDDPKALNIPVQLSYLNITNASGTPLKGTTPAQTMGLMANAGRPSPLVGSFVGPQAVLNDGTTQHELTLRMVNTSLDPLQFIVPPSGSPTQSYIEVAVPVSDVAADAVWALCDSAAWGSVTVAMAGSASKGWKASKSATTDGVITLEPDFSTVQNIPPGGTLELQLSGVVSGLEPGVVQVQVELNRFALIGTQTFGAALEKSPLVYNNGLGTGMTLSAGTLGANTALNVSGDSSGALTHITQSGSGPALQVDGGDVNLSNSLSANSATISESVRINGPSSSSSDPSLSLGGHGNFNIDSDGTTAGRFTVQDGGNVGINNPSPSTTLDVTGDAKISGTVSSNSLTANSAKVNGVISGTDRIGGGAASVQGYGTGGNAGVFAFKYDKANFGDSPKAIQIWNSSAMVFKTFIVNHPLDQEKHLVHATLEGPEGAVYYRGEAQLKNGKCTVTLPDYFEAFTRKEQRTIILTNIDGFDRIAVKSIDGEKIKNGTFVVISENPDSTQKFDWEVKAVRSDGPALEAEPDKKDHLVGGFGPYTFEIAKRKHEERN